MVTEEQKHALRVFHVSVQEINFNISILDKNLEKLGSYINRNLISKFHLEATHPFDIVKPPLPHNPENFLSLIDCIGRLKHCVLQLPHFKDERFSPRLHFAILCAKGGLAANERYFYEALSVDLMAAFETWKTLHEELRIAGENDETVRNMRENTNHYMYELGNAYSAIQTVFRTDH